MRHTVMRGTLLAGLGALILLYGSLFMSVDTLSKWGFPMLCLATFFMSIGLLPYRRLKRLEHTPDELIAIDDLQLKFFSRGKLFLTIPMTCVKKIGYIQKGVSKYGIAIWLKPSQDKIKIHNSQFGYKYFHWKAQRQYGCDLFFSYFSQYSCEELLEHLRPIKEQDDQD